MSEQRKAVIKNADMSEEMQQEAVDCASEALNKFNIEKASIVCVIEPRGQASVDSAFVLVFYPSPIELTQTFPA